MLQGVETRAGAATPELVGRVTRGPSWRKRPIPGSDSFEPILEALVTLTGGIGWSGPVVVPLNVTRLDVGVCTTCGLGVEAPAREAMRRFLEGSNRVEELRLKSMRLCPPAGSVLEALPLFGEFRGAGTMHGTPRAEHCSDRGDRPPRTRPSRFSRGQEVVYVGEEHTPRAEPFGSAREIWVETEESQSHDDVYLYSCRMLDGTWEMGQPGYGRHFKLRVN